MLRMRSLVLTLATVALLVAPASASADRLFGTYGAAPTHIVSFDSSDPSAFLTDLPIAGIGGAETVRGFDVRPANGVAYLLTIDGGQVGRLYTVDPFSG